MAVSVLADGHAQGPSRAGLPGQSDQRQGNPCEHAATPNGHAYGLESQCASGGSGGVAKGDFNGDGFGDLAVGVPFEDIEAVKDAGAAM
jgi:hypothetical protein